ncbi:MAG: hypothetical protein IGR92_12740 [Leptolyngbyaceae cyanobacterium T60_A2020_046]|nr:hypothetical protein [Leptolyngbyaceae cyanobacterium T60_A2020_046]
MSSWKRFSTLSPEHSQQAAVHTSKFICQPAECRGEDAIITIQGSLILFQELGNPAALQRSLKRLPHHLCRDLT